MKYHALNERAKILCKNILTLHRYRDVRVGSFHCDSPCISVDSGAHTVCVTRQSQWLKCTSKVPSVQGREQSKPWLRKQI